MPKKILEYIAPFENVVWDWNGTLLNDREIVFQAEREHFPHYGITPPTDEERNRLFCFPVRTFYERLGFDFEKHSFEQANDHFGQVYERLMREVSLFEGMHELLLDIRTSGKRQFVLSAAPQAHLDEIIPQHEIHEIFEGIYGLPTNHADSKVSRGRELVAKFKLDPAKTIMIGDTEHDYEVACALGFECLLIAEGHKSYEALALVTQKVLRSRYGT